MNLYYLFVIVGLVIWAIIGIGGAIKGKKGSVETGLLIGVIVLIVGWIGLIQGFSPNTAWIDERTGEIVRIFPNSSFDIAIWRWSPLARGYYGDVLIRIDLDESTVKIIADPDIVDYHYQAIFAVIPESSSITKNYEVVMSRGDTNEQYVLRWLYEFNKTSLPQNREAFNQALAEFLSPHLKRAGLTLVECKLLE